MKTELKKLDEQIKNKEICMTINYLGGSGDCNMILPRNMIKDMVENEQDAIDMKFDKEHYDKLMDVMLGKSEKVQGTFENYLGVKVLKSKYETLIHLDTIEDCGYFGENTIDSNKIMKELYELKEEFEDKTFYVGDWAKEPLISMITMLENWDEEDGFEIFDELNKLEIGQTYEDENMYTWKRVE